jgi:hypothetical protein
MTTTIREGSKPFRTTRRAPKIAARAKLVKGAHNRNLELGGKAAFT